MIYATNRDTKARDVHNRYPHQHLQNYPANACDLPQAMLDYAFLDGWKGETHAFVGLGVYARLARLRGP